MPRWMLLLFVAVAVLAASAPCADAQVSEGIGEMYKVMRESLKRMDFSRMLETMQLKARPKKTLEQLRTANAHVLRRHVQREAQEHARADAERAARQEVQPVFSAECGLGREPPEELTYACNLRFVSEATYNAVSAEAPDNCTIIDTDRRCVCPLDWVGEQCEQHRHYECTTVLVSPQADCSEEADELFGYRTDTAGNRPCVVREGGEVELRFRLECAFTDTDDTADSIAYPFTYYARKPDNTWSVFLKAPFFFAVQPVNFYSMTSLEAQHTQRIYEAQLLGTEDIVSTINLDELDDSFFSGGRLYIESSIVLTDIGVRGLQRVQHATLFIDQPDRRERFNRSPSTGLSEGGLAGVLLTVILVVLGAGAFWRHKYEQRRDREKDAEASAKKTE